jgi:lambda family phage tail tape measure protein
MATELILRIRADGTATVVQQVGQVNAALGQLNKQSTGSADSVGKISEQVGDLSAKVGAMGHLSAALLVAPQVIGGVASLASAYKDAALQADKLKNVYAFSFGSAGAGADNLAYVKSTANALGTELLSTADAYGKLSAASIGTALEGEKTRGIFEAISKASAVLGLSSAETGGALLAIQQMMSKGTVQAEELRGQLGERLPGAFQAAARSMGVTTAELGKMLEQGQVLTADFLPKFAAELEKTFGGAAERAANSLQAQINRMENAWNSFKMSLAAPGGGNGGAFDGLAESLNNAAAQMDKLSRNGSGFFKRFFVGLGAVEMEVISSLFGGKGASGEGVTKDQKWITAKLNEIARLKYEGRDEVVQDRWSKTGQAKVAQQQLDDALAANAARDRAKFGAKNADGSYVTPLVDKDALRGAAEEQAGKDRVARQKLYADFGAEAASRNAKLKKQLELESFDSKFAGMKVDNPAYFDEQRKRLVAKLDDGIASEARKAAGPTLDPERFRSEQLRMNNQQATQELRDLEDADRKRKAQERAQAVMDRTVGNLEDKYQQQNAIYSEREMTGPQRALAEALRKVEEAADAAREALAAKAATLEVDDVVAMEAYRQASIRVTDAEGAQIDKVRELQAEQERMNGLWEVGAQRALNKYLDTSKSIAEQTEEAFTRAFQGMEDALMNFLTTGKLNFADFAKSLIADMARIELKALMAKGLGGGSGIGGLFGSLVSMIPGMELGSGIAGNLAAKLNGFEPMNHAALAASYIDAKGGVYGSAGRIEKFANGGIVSSPTLFRFARGGSFGLGLMGEAGDEAVMPLTRDGSGRLGVRAAGGGGSHQITVNINGAGGDPAEIRRAAGQGAREAMAALQGARRYG